MMQSVAPCSETWAISTTEPAFSVTMSWYGVGRRVRAAVALRRVLDEHPAEVDAAHVDGRERLALDRLDDLDAVDGVGELAAHDTLGDELRIARLRAAVVAGDPRQAEVGSRARVERARVAAGAGLDQFGGDPGRLAVGAVDEERGEDEAGAVREVDAPAGLGAAGGPPDVRVVGVGGARGRRERQGERERGAKGA